MRKFDWLHSVLIAKHIIDNNPALITSVQWDRQYLGEKPFDINDRVQTHFSVKPLVPFIKQLLRLYSGLDKVTIEIHKITTTDFMGEGRISGIMAKHSESRYVILINDGETYCTQRFTLCKELAQIYVSCLMSDPLKLNAHDAILEATRELIEQFYGATETPKITDKFRSSETFAHSIALELMIPYTLRGEIAKQIKEGVAWQDLAERLFITKEPLDEYLKNYFDLISPLYKMFKAP